MPKLFGLREWFEKRYKACCKKHDERYYERTMPRKACDHEFLICMLRKTDGVVVPIGAYVFVRLFGWYSYYLMKDGANG